MLRKGIFFHGISHWFKQEPSERIYFYGIQGSYNILYPSETPPVTYFTNMD